MEKETPTNWWQVIAIAGGLSTAVISLLRYLFKSSDRNRDNLWKMVGKLERRCEESEQRIAKLEKIIDEERELKHIAQRAAAAFERALIQTTAENVSLRCEVDELLRQDGRNPKYSVTK